MISTHKVFLTKFYYCWRRFLSLNFFNNTMYQRASLENCRRRLFCDVCAHKVWWKNAAISMAIVVAVIACAVAILYVQHSTDKHNIQMQNTLIVNELDQMVYTLYQSVASTMDMDNDPKYQNPKGLIDKIERTKYYLNLLKLNLHRLVMADGTGRADFALESAGGRIVSIGDTKLYIITPTNFVQRALNYIGIDNTLIGPNNPVNVIQPSMQPGHCFAFVSGGEIVIQLTKEAYISAISIDHILPEMSPDASIRNAPKMFSVYGVRNDWTSVYFGSFIYDITQRYSVQTFDLEKPSTEKFHLIRFRFLSNHGHPEYTCVYRVRVHGNVEPL